MQWHVPHLTSEWALCLDEFDWPPIALHSTNYLAEQLKHLAIPVLRTCVIWLRRWRVGDWRRNGLQWEVATIISERLLGQVFAVCSQIVVEEIAQWKMWIEVQRLVFDG